ncbi:outer membrane lipoprotein chaperone LolA [Magnetococcales bacterium HHB-1]
MNDPCYAYLILLLLLFPHPLQADLQDEKRSPMPPAVQRLQTFVDNLKTIQGHFTQRVTQSDVQSAQISHGLLFAKKPRQFFWHYQKPEEQKIISNGQTVWHYDPELEQATRTSAKNIEETPAAFLVAGGELQTSFNWQVVQDKQWKTPMVRLWPRKNESFKEISVTLHPTKETIVRLILEDNLGNRSDFSFQKVTINQPLSEKLFQFTPPVGSEIIEDLSH